MNKFNFKNYDYKRNLVFVGGVGVGKTYTARQILNNYKNPNQNQKILIYEMKDAKFKQLIKSNQLILRKPEDYQSSILNFPLEMMLRVDVLLYDDLGVSDVSEAYLRDFTFIIDERIEKKLTTIFTTNLTSQELREKLNERIFSRVLFNSDVVSFKGGDKRLTTTNYFVNK